MYTNPNPNLTPQCRARKYGQTDGRTDGRPGVYHNTTLRAYKKRNRIIINNIKKLNYSVMPKVSQVF